MNYKIFSNSKGKFIYLTNHGIILDYNEQTKILLNENSDFVSKRNDSTTQSTFDTLNLTFYLTYDCNLNCEYCFLKQNIVRTNNNLSIETFKNTIDLFLLEHKNVKTVKIRFFGGEPLLRFDFIKICINYLKELKNGIKYLFSITTNGTILNSEIIKVLVENDFGVLISIDGDENIHTKQRPSYSIQNNNFTKIKKNIKKLSKYLDLQARVTLLDFSLDLSYITPHLSKTLKKNRAPLSKRILLRLNLF